jgi:dihydroneopterin triphosphate diphosphatase
MKPRLASDGIAVYVYRRHPKKKSALEFLQIKRSRATGEYQESWQIVYGGIEKNETAVHAALRELAEETALVPKLLFQVEYMEMFYFQHKDYVTVMPVFAAEVAFNASITLNHEHTDHRWVPLAQVAKQFMWRSQREAITVIVETLAHPGPALKLLTVDLAPHRSPAAHR